MKKARKSGSTRKVRSKSKGSFSFGKSSGTRQVSVSKANKFFSRKSKKNPFIEKSVKQKRAEEKKDRFVKPPNDPGPKIREEEVEVIEDYSVENGGDVVQQTLQSTGRGCLSSFTGIVKFMIFGGLAVFIILVLKCGGC